MFFSCLRSLSVAVAQRPVNQIHIKSAVGMGGLNSMTHPIVRIAAISASRFQRAFITNLSFPRRVATTLAHYGRATIPEPQALDLPGSRGE
jgi:hypothetical protein